MLNILYIILTLLLLTVCITNNPKVSSSGASHFEEESKYWKNDGFSVVIYRLYIEGELLKDTYSSDCTKKAENELPDDDYYGSIEYGDLLFSFRTSPELVGSYIQHHNSFNIMQNKKIMTVVIPSEYIGKHFYIDSLPFKEGQYHLNLKNNKPDKISLENKSNELESWKNSEQLIDLDCIKSKWAYVKIDSVSNENFIKTIMKLNYYAIEQSNLITLQEYKNH